MRRLLAIALLFSSLALIHSPANAGQVPPMVVFDRAWTVAKGAAIEAAYFVTCPDPADSEKGYRSAMWTSVDGSSTSDSYLEFRCTQKRQRVVQLLQVPGKAGSAVTLRTRVVSPQCLYFDYTEADPEMGCRWTDVSTSTSLKSGTFLPDAWVDLGGDVQVTKVQRAAGGGLRLTARFSCTVEFFHAQAMYLVTQMTRNGFVSKQGTTELVECEPGRPQTITWLAMPDQPGRGFARGDVVVSVDWIYHGEGGPWGLYTGVHRVKSNVGPSKAPRPDSRS